MNKEIDGIIVSAVDYKENSKIINILTKTGIIGVLAKGSKNPKNKLCAVSTVLTYGTFYLNNYKGSIPILTEVDVKKTFKNIKKNIIKTNYTLFLIELATQVYRHENNQNIYTILINGLTKIDDGFDAQVITDIIELQLLKYLGIKPVIDKCVNCQNSKNIITISSYKGGYLCDKCVGTEPIYHIKTVAMIRNLYYLDISKITKIDVNEIVKRELNDFIFDYYERYSGLYLKSKHLIEKFAKLEFE